MPIVYIEDIDNFEQITKIRSYDVIEYGDHIYCCRSGPPQPGDAVVTLDPNTGACIIAKIESVNDNEVILQYEGKTFKKQQEIGAFHPLDTIAKLSDVEQIRKGIKTGCEEIIAQLKGLPALSWSILYSKKFTIDRSSGDVTISCKIADGYISTSVKVGEEISTCKFSYSAKHETIEKKLAPTLAYQLFGEELVYIRNRINSLVSN